MSGLLVLIHTVSPLINVFDRLAVQMLPGVKIKHILDEPLLEIVRLRGNLNDADAERLFAHASLGAAVGANAVLVTCSTISPLVDGIRPRLSLPIIKIDEAMFERALQLGQFIHVIATNPTTLEPTRWMLLEKAARSGRGLTITQTLVEGAFAALLSGDGETHDDLVRQAVMHTPAGTDVVILAQASMARVMEGFNESELSLPVLSSPHLALERLRGILLELKEK